MQTPTDNSKKRPGTAKKEPSPVVLWSAVYSHDYGKDVRVFKREPSAKRWRTEIAIEWWDVEFPDEPKPARSKIGEAYFDNMLNRDGSAERFYIQAVRVED